MNFFHKVLFLREYLFLVFDPVFPFLMVPLVVLSATRATQLPDSRAGDFEPMQFCPRILASRTHYFYFPVIHHYFTGKI